MAKAREAMQWMVLVVVVFCIVAAEATSRVPTVVAEILRDSPPEIQEGESTAVYYAQVFTCYPPKTGEENTFQCYADGFHPPKISIKLLKKSDPSFHQDWAFHQLVYTNVTIDGKTEYACKVEHETLREPQIHKLEWDF